MSINPESIDPIGIADGFRSALPYEPSEDDKLLAQRVEDRFRRAMDAKNTVDQDMDFWRRYVKGEQSHWYLDRDSGQVVRLFPKDSKRLSSMNNVLRPSCRSLVGKLTRMVPTFQFVPPTMDAAEVQAARVADAFFDYFRRKEELEVKYSDLYEDVVHMGTGVVQLEWDPTAGEKKAFCPECESSFAEDLIGSECLTCAADLQEAAAMDMESGLQEAQMMGTEAPGLEHSPAAHKEIPILQDANDGDAIVHVRDPRDIFIEPGVTEPRKLRWCVYRSVEPVTEVRRRFPEMGQFIGPSRQGQDSYAARYDASPLDLDEHVTLLEYHEVPTELYPKGRIVWVAEGIILKELESPYYTLKRLPFFFFRWVINRGEFWGESFVAQAWHRQKELNAIETVFREYAELISRAKVLVPLASRVSTDEFTPTTGQAIKYNSGAGAKPEYMVPPEMPQSMFNRRMEITEDIRIQAGITSQEAGLDVKDPNGRAMAIVEAEADQQTGPIIRRNIAEWSWLHRGLLLLVKERYSPERKFTVAGEDNYAETFSFSELNLSPGWDIQMEVEDGLSKNQALRLTQAGEMLQWGVFTDPQTGMPDMRKFVRVARIKVPGVGPDLVSPDYAAAMDLIRKVKRGEPAEPQSFDDAVIFAEVLYGWLKSHGRREDPFIVQQIEQMWQFYTQWAVSGMPPQGVPVTGASGQGDASAPGGTPNNSGMLGTDLAAGNTGQVGSEAGAMIQQADGAAEQGARTTTQREG